MLFGFLLVVAGLVYLEATKPQPINWFPSYSNAHKIPLGTFVLFDLLKDNFEDDLQEISETPFEKLQDTTLSGTYLFINDQVDFNKTELKEIFNWVERGNTIFVSANNIGQELLDTLKIETKTAMLFNKFTTQPLLNLVNNKLSSETPFHIERSFVINYFKEIDTLKQSVLGISQVYNDTLKITKPLVNFIKAPFGNGNFYLHTQPEIFSNYFLLSENNVDHTKNVLSYINNESVIYWDKNYKSGKKINVSPLYILFNNKYLKWSYYFVLINILLFVLFEGKRKQRSISIIKPLSNKTYQYTRTISGMYLDKKENHEIAKKQIILFFEFIRTRLRVQTDIINSRFFIAVAARSGNDIDITKKLFIFIEKVQHQHTTTKEELIMLNKEISEFKNNINGTA